MMKKFKIFAKMIEKNLVLLYDIIVKFIIGENWQNGTKKEKNFNPWHW